MPKTSSYIQSLLPPEAKYRLVKDWLNKAKSDLASARKLASGSEYYLDTAIYHCQQCAEKAIKGYLVFHDKRVTKTHDIQDLLTNASVFEKTIVQWMEAGENLSQYATMFRYPGEHLEPTESQFKKALQEAGDIFSYIQSLLPPEVRP